jgi:hypothetical protein
MVGAALAVDLELFATILPLSVVTLRILAKASEDSYK